MKLLFYIIKELLSNLWEWILKRIPYRNKICWLVKHRYKSVYIKSEYSGLKPPEGVLVGDTEAGCVYCGKKTKNRWPEYQLDRERKV